MYYFIQVQKESPTLTVHDNFDHSIVRIDSGSDYMNCSLSDVIRQHLDEFNRKNIFSPESFTVYENSSYYSLAICDGDYYSYTFSCYLFFDKAVEVIEFVNSFYSDTTLQYKFKFLLKDIIDRFSSDSSFSISAVEIKDIVMASLI